MDRIFTFFFNLVMALWEGIGYLIDLFLNAVDVISREFIPALLGAVMWFAEAIGNIIKFFQGLFGG